MPRLHARPSIVTVPVERQPQVYALLRLAQARRALLEAALYLRGSDAGRNFAALIREVESRIDRIRLHGLGPIADGTEPPLIATGVDGGSSVVTREECSW